MYRKDKAIEKSAEICRKDFMSWLRKEIKKDWGEKCKEFERSCPVCEAWFMYELLKDNL